MRYSRILLVSLILLWFVLPLPYELRFSALGLIAIYLSLHNYLVQKAAREGKLKAKKIEMLDKKVGKLWAPRMYTILFVFLPLALGLYILITGIMLYLNQGL